jgi:selenocysteine-specific elongation factor
MLAPTKLASSPIVPVSSQTGDGLERLIDTIHSVLRESEVRRNIGRPRLPIDRVFSISGFGTIVTGTLIDGDLYTGQEVIVLPNGQKSRIRGLQTHKQKIEAAVPGSRVAANLTGVEAGELERGDVVSIPGAFSATCSVEVYFRHLADTGTNLRHNMSLKMYIGSSQREARIRLLGRDEIKPGETGWLQIMLDKPIVAARGDHYVLRRPSPGTTLGGGVIVEPHPRRKRKRFEERNIQRLEELLQGEPSDLLAQSLNDLGPTKLAEAVQHASIEKELEDLAIRELHDRGDLVNLEDGQSGDIPKMNALVVSREVWNDIIDRIEKILGLFHRENTLRLGMPFEELKTRLSLPSKVFNSIIRRAEGMGVIQIDRDRVALSGHKVALTKTQEKAKSELLDVYRARPYATPSVKESIKLVGDDVYQYLLETNELLQVSHDVVLRYEDFQEMSDLIQKVLKKEGSITVAEVRDLFSTSRKYALAVMEHLDAVGITARKGDKRVLA